MDLEYFEHFLIKSDIIYIDRRLTLRKNDRETIMYSNFHKKSSLSIIIRLIFIKVYCVCVCVCGLLCMCGHSKQFLLMYPAYIHHIFCNISQVYIPL